MQANDLPPDARNSAQQAWRARLLLRYSHESGRTVLAHREHEGPLAVQKSLYPEGVGICHNFVLHPPAGIANGDELDIHIRLEEQAHVVLSTPGAGKWYRSAGAQAHQRLHFDLAARSILEWLPQETILYSAALANLHTRIDLSEGAAYLGWEITCLGLPASNALFLEGALKQRIEIYREGRLKWCEQGQLRGNDDLLASPVGLSTYSVNANLLAVGRKATPEIMSALRALNRPDRLLAVTAIDDLIVLRHLGHSAQAARELYAECRALLRPWLCSVVDQPLRIWRT